MCSIRLCHRLTDMLVAQASHHAKWGNLGALRINACDESLHIHTAYDAGKKTFQQICNKIEDQTSFGCVEDVLIVAVTSTAALSLLTTSEVHHDELSEIWPSPSGPWPPHLSRRIPRDAAEHTLYSDGSDQAHLHT